MIILLWKLQIFAHTFTGLTAKSGLFDFKINILIYFFTLVVWGRKTGREGPPCGNTFIEYNKLIWI